MRETSLRAVIEAIDPELHLTHVTGSLERKLAVLDERLWPADLVGHLNLIHPGRVQIVGAAEMAWARRLGQKRIAHHLSEIFAAKPPALIVADGCTPPPILEALCRAHDVALFTTDRPSAEVIDRLRHHLSRVLAEREMRHGVLMDVLGLGVFITGDPGTGKSELALELISRGHGLVADDMVEFARISPTVLEGRCPPLLQNYLEVRGLGLLDIRTIFGETALRRRMRLRLIVHLRRLLPGEPPPPRLEMEQVTEEILGVPIPKATLPVAAGRNLAVLLEAAVRATILRLRGIDSTREFIDRHNALLAQQSSTEADPHANP